jgi:hypothetical protein
MSMGKWLGIGVAALIAAMVASSWSEIERYRRIKAM